MKVNELEALFARAFQDPTVRPAFYRLLMRSEVLVLTADESRVQTPSIIVFPRDQGGEVVPVFTSENTLRLDSTMPLDDPHAPRVSWMSMRAVMEVTRGRYIYLNPRCVISREFTPEQIAWLLKDETIHFGTGDPDTVASGVKAD